MGEPTVNGVKRKHTITIDNINQRLPIIEYAVQGPMVVRAREMEKELKQGGVHPFTEVIKANIGDGQAMGQPPITFIRQVIALISYPALLDDNRFDIDVKKRAEEILSVCEGRSVGAYSDKKGIETIRRHVADYIEQRDGTPADFKNIVLTAGATDGIKSVLKLLDYDEGGKKAGVMTPIPQYPLYSATLAEYGMNQINYHLDESKEWGLDVHDMQKSINEAKKVCNPRAIVIINPGNPTGQVLSRDNIEEIIKFAYRENLFILADEVYQDNIYAEDRQFYSFKKVLIEMGYPYSQMELASFMSTSKGYMSECGLRGGYVELVNLLPEILALYYKLMSAAGCPTVIGQAVLDCIVKPPTKDMTSYPLFMKERTEVIRALSERAKMVASKLNSIPGMTCNEVQGAMYAFPQIHLPEKMIAKAHSTGQSPDGFYTMSLLEKTGICLVPGTGFGQKAGTYHFRTTILPKPEKLKYMLEKLCEFHVAFLNEYK